MEEVIVRANKYINLEEAQKRNKQETAFDRPRGSSAMVRIEEGECSRVRERREGNFERRLPYQSQPTRKGHEASGSRSERRIDELDPFRYYALTVSPEQMVRELRKKKEGDVKWPKKMLAKGADRDTAKFCAFHNDHGHTTSECRQLKWEIEVLIRRGHLDEFIPKRNPNPKEERRTNERRRAASAEKKEEDRTERRTIFTIHGGFASGGSSMSSRRRHIKRAEVAAVREATLGKATPNPPIQFTDEDKEGVHYPHDDALVLELAVANCDMTKVLIDTGSSVNIIFTSTLK